MYLSCIINTTYQIGLFRSVINCHVRTNENFFTLLVQIHFYIRTPVTFQLIKVLIYTNLIKLQAIGVTSWDVTFRSVSLFQHYHAVNRKFNDNFRGINVSDITQLHDSLFCKFQDYHKIQRYLQCKFYGKILYSIIRFC